MTAVRSEVVTLLLFIHFVVAPIVYVGFVLGIFSVTWFLMSFLALQSSC